MVREVIDVFKTYVKVVKVKNITMTLDQIITHI